MSVFFVEKQSWKMRFLTIEAEPGIVTSHWYKINCTWLLVTYSCMDRFSIQLFPVYSFSVLTDLRIEDDSAVDLNSRLSDWIPDV